eukprot:6885941-Pyramimonas_sp.AAC.1
MASVKNRVRGEPHLWVWRPYIVDLTDAPVVGSPSEEDLQFISSDKARRYIRSLPHHDRVQLKTLYPRAVPQAIDLIDKMLGQ